MSEIRRKERKKGKEKRRETRKKIGKEDAERRGKIFLLWSEKYSSFQFGLSTKLFEQSQSPGTNSEIFQKYA